MTDLLEAISDAKDIISLLPDESLAGGTPSDLRASMDSELTSAQTALDEEDVVDAVSHIGAAVDLVSDHVATSCPRRWLTTTLNCVIFCLNDSASLTTPSDTTPTPTTTTRTAPVLGEITIVVIATLTVVVLIGIVWKLRRGKA
jgi:hypothetical protein